MNSSMFGQPLHEALHRELKQNPGLVDDWAAHMADPNQEWISAYEQHPVVVQATLDGDRETTYGICLYMDGAEFENRESLLIMTGRFIFSHVRHLIWFVRKSNLCDCGCGGWCTMYPLFRFIAWSLHSLTKGVFPSAKWDTTPLDDHREKLVNDELGFKAPCLDITGDLKEFTERWGFPTWQAHLGCFLCTATKAQIRDVRHTVARRHDDEYEHECEHCEIVFSVTTVALQNRIRFALIDNSKNKGLCLREDIEGTPLRRGDRLEPSTKLPDVYEFWKQVVPFIAMFWRIPKQYVSVHHRNPVLSKSLGTGYSTFGLDGLHTMHLGVFLSWSTRAVHYLVEADIFQTRHTRKEDHLRECALAIKSILADWYPVYERSLSDAQRRGMTRVNHLTASMLGAADGISLLSLKAAESRHFLPFMLDLTRRHAEQLAPICDIEALINSGQRLMDWMQVVNSQPRKMSTVAASALVSLIEAHNIEAERAGVRIKPKHHAADFSLFWN